MERKKRNIDLLSGLPDDVLHHILSFLSTSDSARTSVLSKRWRFVWAHVPDLCFYKPNFSDDQTPLDIINRVAMLHQAEILNTFELSLWKGYCPSYQLDTLIIYLLTKRTLRNLYLDLGYKCEDDLVCALPTRLLFTCKTLVDLELVNCGLIPSTGELFLPSLKKLYLSYVNYESDESLPHWLSGCPQLEELNVQVCLREGRKKNSSCVIASSPTVKTLRVNFFNLGRECPDKMLVIDVPALEYLTVDYCDLDSLESLDKTMTSLIEAKITLNGSSHMCRSNCNEHSRSIEFLSCLSRARCLRISSDFAESLVNVLGTGPMPKFVNLTKLQLKLTVDWYKVVEFLEVADNLEVLIVSLHEMPPYTEPKRVPPCMVSRLRNVTLNYFGAGEDGFDLVRYILKNALALEWMEIYAEAGSSDKDNFDALQRISLFERGSTSCQLDFNTEIKSYLSMDYCIDQLQ